MNSRFCCQGILVNGVDLTIHALHFLGRCPLSIPLFISHSNTPKHIHIHYLRRLFPVEPKGSIDPSRTSSALFTAQLATQVVTREANADQVFVDYNVLVLQLVTREANADQVFVDYNVLVLQLVTREANAAATAIPWSYSAHSARFYRATICNKHRNECIPPGDEPPENTVRKAMQRMKKRVFKKKCLAKNQE
ncbi:uncharacterized protein LOC117193944 [Drosophila miranda]|uniref:uncharacterized protein LOC117193943 n=1 Tax=Drosophila miranda TaxID=7229 RepID=UPI00143F73B3|nr:uncharacterized protein LOC117193943 [Drosophila miranda]XP_033254497.1 uncharacterized protein LOC117193944 [Drosophila miranda]